VKETDDYIMLDGKKMKKPIVEKPFAGDDHNIYIYYSKDKGGGCRKLFRKVKNKSSSFFADINTIRRDGSYCYEQFIEGVKDLKVSSGPITRMGRFVRALLWTALWRGTRTGKR